MARNYFLTTNALTALTDPDAVLATPLNLGDEAHRFDDNGQVTADLRDLNFYNVHTVIIPPGNSGVGETDTLRGTAGNDLIFWDYQALSLLSVSLSLVTRQGLPSLNAIERFDLGDGNDLINLTYNAGGVLLPSPGAYTANATIFGGDGNDVVWSGAGSDKIFGDNGNDTLDGGAGNDTIYGGAGIDTLMGGSGDDTLFGGEANVSLLDGGVGGDWIELKFSDVSFVANLTGGTNTGSDGNDTMFTTGVYNTVSASLGGGADVYIGSMADETRDHDVVFGGIGNDVISAQSGGDTIYGGDDGDFLWGGAGADTIFGDGGDDIIYAGSGGANVMYGGAGQDFFYLYRNDGAGNQIYDLFREGSSEDHSLSALVVVGDPNFVETGGDYIQNGTGLRETDHNIMDNNGPEDMVWVHQISGTIYQLDVIGGTGTVGMTVQFDARDVPNIILWDNDAVLGQVQDLYTWNGSNGYDHWTG